MYNFELWPRQKEECFGNLLGEFSRQVQADAAKTRVPEQVVQVIRQQFKHQTQVVPPHEMVLQLDHVVLIIVIRPVHHFKESDLNLSLDEKWFLVFDDLDGHMFLGLVIIGLDDLSKTATTDQRIDFIPI